MVQNEFVNYVIYFFCYIGGSYFLHLLLQILIEISLNFENKQYESIISYILCDKLFGLLLMIVYALNFCFIAPIIILGIENHFKAKLTNTSKKEVV